MISSYLKYAVLCCSLSMAFSCYYDVEEGLYQSIECTTEGLTYTGDIQPILERRCYVCHSAVVNSGNITLEGHDQLLTYVNSGQLSGAIKHEPGYSPMPKNASPLLDCEIEKIETWIAGGAPND